MLVAVRSLGNFALRIRALDRRDHAAQRVDLANIFAGAVVGLVRQRFHKIRSPQRIRCICDAAFIGDDLLGSQRQSSGEFRRQRPSFIQRIRVQRLRPAHHRGQRLNRRAHHIVVRLLRRKRAACRLRVETQRPGARIFCAKALAHLTLPDAARGAIFGDFFKKIVVRIEKERKARREIVHCQAPPDAPLDVFDAVTQRERELLNGRGAGLADMITADGDGIEPRRMACPKLERVNHQPQRRLGRIDVLLLRDVFLEDIVLKRPRQQLPIRALLFCHGQIHGPDDGRGRVYSHRCRDFGERDAIEEHLHIRKRTYGYPALAYFALRERMIGVVAHQRRQIESHGEPSLALLQQIPEARVGIFGSAEAGKLAHGPQPATIHRRVNAARVGRLAGPPQVALSLPVNKIGCRIKLADGMAGYGGEVLRTRRRM